MNAGSGITQTSPSIRSDVTAQPTGYGHKELSGSRSQDRNIAFVALQGLYPTEGGLPEVDTDVTRMIIWGLILIGVHARHVC